MMRRDLVVALLPVGVIYVGCVVVRAGPDWVRYVREGQAFGSECNISAACVLEWAEIGSDAIVVADPLSTWNGNAPSLGEVSI